MTLKEFIKLAKNDKELSASLEAEAPADMKSMTALAKRHGYEITCDELDEAELSNVAAGFHHTLHTEKPSVDGKYYHRGCDGEILNAGNPFSDCVCSKCGETHYFLLSFDSYQKYVGQ